MSHHQNHYWYQIKKSETCLFSHQLEEWYQPIFTDGWQKFTFHILICNILTSVTFLGIPRQVLTCFLLQSIHCTENFIEYWLWPCYIHTRNCISRALVLKLKKIKEITNCPKRPQLKQYVVFGRGWLQDCPRLNMKKV